MQIIKKLLFGLIAMLLISSCGLKKKLVYFQGEDQIELSRYSYTPVFKADDLLQITVTADDPETALPFNQADPSAGLVRGNLGYSTGAPVTTGYLIDSTGQVNMPVIGKVKVLGLNRVEATQLIEDKLKQYLSNPVVQIRIMNFRVTVLGDVRTPGTFTIPNERITILEAIGLAGDLTITGNRKSVTVIRNEGDSEKQFKIDLTSKEIFNSPVYYLDQNDVVYVEPNAGARTQSTVWAKAGTFFVSVSSVIVSTIAVITK